MNTYYVRSGEFVNISGVAAQRIAVDTPVSTIGRVGIDTYLFLESGNVTSEAGDEWWLVEEGDMKFNIFVSEWEFCNPCGSGNNEVRVHVSIRSPHPALRVPGMGPHAAPPPRTLRLSFL